MVLGHQLIGKPIGGGVMLSPLIGLLMAEWTHRFRPQSSVGRALFALLALYNAALLFGLGVGVYDGLTVDPAHQVFWEVLAQDALGVLWGLTFTGYVLFLWPLAAWNQSQLWRLE